jgi:hypothetical protein
MKSRTEYVRKEYVKEVRRQTVTHKRFKRLVDQWIDLSIEHSRLDHADCGTEGKPIGWNSMLARRIQNGEVGIRQTACGSSRADDAQRRRDRRAL